MKTVARNPRRRATPVRAQKKLPARADANAAQTANELVAKAELGAVNLVDVKAHFSVPALAHSESDQLDFRLPSPEFRSHYDSAAGALYCGVRFHAGVGSDKQKSDVLSVDAEYALLYQLPANTRCTTEAATLFAGRNAVHNAWPFFRELLFGLVAKMGMPPLILPLYRIPVSPPRKGPPPAAQQ